MALVKCLYCGQRFDRDKEEWVKPRANRYAHKNCYENNLNDNEKRFIEKVKNILGNNIIETKVASQVARYLKEGKSYEDIFKTLEYFYIIKNNNIENARGGIGIIPYVYDEAMRYFERKEKIKNRVIDKDETEVQIKEVEVKRSKIKKPVNVNFFSIE